MYLVNSLPGIRGPMVRTEKWVSKETTAKVAESVAFIFLIVGAGGVALYFVPSINFSASLYLGAGTIGMGGLVLITSGIAYLITHRKKAEDDSLIDDNSPTQRLSRLNDVLTDQIKRTPQVKEQGLSPNYGKAGWVPGKAFFAPFRHVECVFECVYIGNYRAYLSVDPEFLEHHAMIDNEQKIFKGEPTEAQKWAMHRHLDHRGCSELAIEVVISLTKWSGYNNVESGHWSKFKPNLEDMGITHFVVPVDDTEKGWDVFLERDPYSGMSYLNYMFQMIDNARVHNKLLLIHCAKGATRSASVLIAYLMSRCGVNYDEAVNFLKDKRGVLDIKPSWEKGLKAYEKSLQGD